MLSLSRRRLSDGRRLPVESRHVATRDLMVAFYRGLKAGKRMDEALREAMLRSIAPNRASPYYWAAFQVMGETQPLPRTDGSVR